MISSIYRIGALVKIKHLEFMRDRGALMWNILFPLVLLVFFSFVFTPQSQTIFKIARTATTTLPAFFDQPGHHVIIVNDSTAGIQALSTHNIDVFFDHEHVWLNRHSERSRMIQQLLEVLPQSAEQTQSEPKTHHYQFEYIDKAAIPYLQWVIPGIIGMNLMFSCLFGVSYHLVRDRNQGILKRLRFTPTNAFEFIVAQVLSRTTIVLLCASIVFSAALYLTDLQMKGHYLDLLIVTLLSTVCMIAFGLLLVSRINSEEFASSILNMATWPMMICSGIWFSLNDVEPWLEQFAQWLPLTHFLAASRQIIYDGATLSDLGIPLSYLVLMTISFIGGTSLLLRWKHP